MPDRILRLRRMIAREFLRCHWDALAELTDCADVVCGYEQLGARHWGDNAYDACVLQVLTTIVDRSPEKLDAIEAFVKSVCVDDPHEFTNATLVRR